MAQPELPGPARASWHPAHLVPAALAALTGVVLVLVTLRHGIDWSDESFVWTMIASDRIAFGEAWGFQHLVHPVFTLVGESVLAMRVLRLVGYVAVSVVLTWAASRVLRAAGVELRRREQGFVLLVAQVGTLLAWSYPPRYLGYNELSAWLSALIAAALAVELLPLERDDRRRRALPWLAVGVLIAPLLLAKFTAAVVWGLLALIALALPVTGTPRWFRLAAMATGGMASTAAMVVIGVPFFTVLRNAYGMLFDSSAQEASDHSISHILQTYLTSTQVTGRGVVLPLVVLLALGLFCVRARRGTVAGAAISLLLAGAFAALLARPAIEGTWPGLGMVAAAVGVGGALVLVVAARVNLPAAAPVLSLTAVLLLALGAPLVAPVGTNNHIWGHTVFSATPWAVLCGVALCLLARTAPPLVRTGPLLLGGLLVALTSTAVAFEVSVHPYRSTPLLEQTTPTSVPPLAGMLLSEEEAARADWLHSVAVEQGAAGVPAVSLVRPGYLFMFNRSGWGSPWAGGIWQAAIARNCEQEAPDDLFVLEPESPKKTIEVERVRLQEALVGCGLEFPDDFEVVAQRHRAVVWRLQGEDAR